MSGGGYPKFRNDRGVPEICIGVKEFMCIGESPPQDHPHVYINMGEADTILGSVANLQEVRIELVACGDQAAIANSDAMKMR
jgi:uncharacterized Zn-finger protein